MPALEPVPLALFDPMPCAYCGVQFERDSPERVENFCSRVCQTSARDMERATRMLTSTTERLLGHPASFGNLTPGQSARIRGLIAAVTEQHVALAHQVILGHVKWSNSQVAVFKTLINKVTPDLNASFVQHETKGRKLSEYTEEELMALIEEDDRVVAAPAPCTPASPQDAPDDHEPPETGVPLAPER